MVIIHQIIRSPRKTISLTIQPDGKLLVRAPLHTPTRIIEELVNSKSDWVISRQKAVLAALKNKKSKQFIEGETFLFLGQAYPLTIIPHSRERLTFDHQFKLASRAQPKALQVFEKWYKNQAMLVFSERTAWFAKRYGFKYKKINITSARTRWGSCSSRGSISFTWRLIMAPLSVIDYVIIHELVHTVERNHAHSFWEKVAAIMPDYKDKKAWLKKNGVMLNLS